MPPGRGSSCAERPIHRTYLSLCVRYAKTSSGVASMKISRTIGSSSATLRSFSRLDLSLEDRKAIGPKNLEEGTDFAEGLLVHPVQSLGPLAPLLEQSDIGEQP